MRPFIGSVAASAWLVPAGAWATWRAGSTTYSAHAPPVDVWGTTTAITRSPTRSSVTVPAPIGSVQ
ncbi:hypothetical protein [Streptomyces sp. NPDC056160]|uniref:hypothetical protein n=1 Tax=Streptomyces sp. NPDC056160 TaxID=3345731 RepID=UPI0035DED6A8